MTALLALTRLGAEKPGRKVAYAFALVAGLGLSHHRTLVLLVAPLAAWIAWTGRSLWRPRDGLVALAVLGAGLLPYADLPLAAMADPPIQWGDFRTVAGCLAHLTRADYGCLQLGADAVGVEGLFLTQLGYFVVSLAENCLWLGVPRLGTAPTADSPHKAAIWPGNREFQEGNLFDIRLTLRRPLEILSCAPQIRPTTWRS